MTIPRLFPLCKAGLLALALFGDCLFTGCAHVQMTSMPKMPADWQKDDTSIAWGNGTNVYWRFTYDTNKGKPFFHPVAANGGIPLTNFKPSDHPWHYGLWFSWKYINHPGDTNHLNYWEEDRTTGVAQGKTRWKTPSIKTKSDGSADIRLDLSYVNPSGFTDMTEAREIKVSAPATDGSFMIDWTARFTVGKKPVILDRTPMLGEPGGQTNGGYAGLAARMAPLPVTMDVMTIDGPAAAYVGRRVRPSAAAVACNFSDSGRDIGGLAFFTDPKNAGKDAPWYIVSSEQMPFINESVLAPQPLSYDAGAKFTLRYRIAVSGKAWTQAALEAGQKKWLSGK